MPSIQLQNKGGRWYHSDDYTSPTLTKASLGSFLYEVLSVGGEIGTIWPFNPRYKRSSVYFTVFMTPEMKADIESRTRFRFRDPPKISLN